MGSALMMGFLGSWHCGLMCGPLSCNFKGAKSFMSYHIGRLISYLALGTVLYYGTHYFVDTDSRILKMSASLVFGILFIYFGLVQMGLFRNNRFFFKYYKFQFKLVEMNKEISQKFPVVLGLLTGLFPCTWLYSFLLLSTQMKTLMAAAGIIFIFWVTALPAFIAFGGIVQKLIRHSPVSYQKLAGGILIFAGLLSLFGHWSDILAQ